MRVGVTNYEPYVSGKLYELLINQLPNHLLDKYRLGHNNRYLVVFLTTNKDKAWAHICFQH